MEEHQATPSPCMACGYDMAGLDTRTCPECGYTVTEEDRSLAERRAFYLDATRWEVWTASIAVVVCAALFSGAFWNQMGQVWIAVFGIAFGLAQVGGVVASRRMPRTHQQVFRRAWKVAVVYWSIPTVTVHLVFQFIVEYWGFNHLWSFRQERWLVICVGIQVLVQALAVPFWYRSWRRTSRLAGVPEAMRTLKRFRRGVLLAVVPVAPFAGLFLIGLIIAGAMALLDRLFPGWELGR